MQFLAKRRIFRAISAVKQLRNPVIHFTHNSLAPFSTLCSFRHFSDVADNSNKNLLNKTVKILLTYFRIKH